MKPYRVGVYRSIRGATLRIVSIKEGLIEYIYQEGGSKPWGEEIPIRIFEEWWPNTSYQIDETETIRRILTKYEV